MADDEPQVPEELKLNNDGTVTALLDGERVTLRRPRLGEFRKLRELLWETQDTLEEQGGPLRDARKSLTDAKGGDETVLRAVLDEVTKLNRAWQETNEDANLAWVRAAFEMLGDKPLGANDDLPIWAAASQTIEALVEHWRSVPLGRGTD